MLAFWIDPGTVFISGRSTLAPRMTQTTHAPWFLPPGCEPAQCTGEQARALLAALPSQSVQRPQRPSHSAEGPERGCARELQALLCTDFIKGGGEVTLFFLVPRGVELKSQPAPIFRGLLGKRMLLSEIQWLRPSWRFPGGPCQAHECWLYELVLQVWGACNH